MVSKFTVRTSDRRVFRRCMRKWNWQSSIRENLRRKGTEQNANFWFGSGIHFAMEDWHGLRRFDDPRKAFHAYYLAHQTEPIEGAAEYHKLAMSMLTYYLLWYEKRNAFTEFETVWFKDDYQLATPEEEGAFPGVEVTFTIPLGVKVFVDMKTDKILGRVDLKNPTYYDGGVRRWDLPEGTLTMYKAINGGYDNVDEFKWVSKDGTTKDVYIRDINYHGMIDRIVRDKFGRYWLLDYKTAKGADTNKLDTDDQISAYLWAVTEFLNIEVYGFIYLQLTKDIIQEPKRLKNGELSIDKRQKTTYTLVRQAIVDEYEEVQNAPAKLVEFLNYMASQETAEGDRFIRWDFVKRSPEQLNATFKTIMAELDVMLWPNLIPFPNPTRDCIWDCPLREACLALDREDNEGLELFFKDWEYRPHDEDGQVESWRTIISELVDEVNAMSLDDIMAEVGPELTILLDGSDTNEDLFRYDYEN